MAKLNPPLPFELAVSSTHRVGMKSKPSRQFSRARQSLPRRQIAAEDTQHNLRYKLFADGDFAAARKPELHGALS